MVHKTNRGDNFDFAAAHIGFIHHTAYATKMIGMGMRVYDGDHWTLAQLLIDEL